MSVEKWTTCFLIYLKMFLLILLNLLQEYLSVQIEYFSFLWRKIIINSFARNL